MENSLKLPSIKLFWGISYACQPVTLSLLICGLYQPKTSSYPKLHSQENHCLLKNLLDWMMKNLIKKQITLTLPLWEQTSSLAREEVLLFVEAMIHILVAWRDHLKKSKPSIVSKTASQLFRNYSSN